MLWRRVLARHRDVPDVAFDAPGVFRFATERAIRQSLERSGLGVDHVEELWVPVVDVEDGAALVAWVLHWAGLPATLVGEMPAERQRAWAEDLAREAKRYQVHGTVVLGGVTRLVVAMPRAGALRRWRSVGRRG